MVSIGASENGQFDIKSNERFSSFIEYMLTKYQGNAREPYQQGEVKQLAYFSTLQISSESASLEGRTGPPDGSPARVCTTAGSACSNKRSARDRSSAFPLGA